MGLWWQRPLACSINKWAGLGAWNIHAIHATMWNPSCYCLSAELRSPSCACGASTPMCGIPSLYVSTLWRLCYSYFALIGYDDVEVATRTTTRRRWLWSTTSSTPMRDYIGSLLQLCHSPVLRTESKPIYVCPRCSNHTYRQQYGEQKQYGIASLSCDDLCATCMLQVNTTGLRLFHYCIMTYVSTCDA
jgi:hypothetical protein